MCPSCVLQEPQREQLSALLDNIYAEFASTVGAARGKTVEEVGQMLDEGIYGAPNLRSCQEPFGMIAAQIDIFYSSQH